ncbi:hypothetical protein J437_LFUL006195, partial [Ladona fulva]
IQWSWSHLLQRTQAIKGDEDQLSSFLAVPCVLNVNNTLTWAEHIALNCNKVYKTLVQMKQLKNLIPMELCRKFLNYLLIPHIDYCLLVFVDLTKELRRNYKLCSMP